MELLSVHQPRINVSPLRTRTLYILKMARSCAAIQPQRPIITTVNENEHDHEIEMQYDPCRKAVQRESEISPYDKVDGQQGFTCTYVPNDDTNEIDFMSPISVTLHQAHSQAQAHPQPKPMGTWDELVQNEVVLGDTGAPAALDPDDTPRENPVHGQGEEKKETWSELVVHGAVLGDDGTNELDMDKKVKLWGMTCGV